jgi:aspartate racemase
MKTVGIIGGIGPESTIEYYRLIITLYREQKRDGSYPSILINSINLTRMLDLIGAKKLVEVAEYLVDEVTKLAHAGGDLGLLAANTPHIVFEDIRRQSPIPLISIVEATCQAAQALGLKKVGLYMSELVNGVFRAETQERLLTIVDRLTEREGIQGLILGGTELPLILGDVADRKIPFLDTTRIHVEEVVAQMLSGEGA